MPTYKIFTKKTQYFESIVDGETPTVAYKKFLWDGGPEGYECFDDGEIELVAIYLSPRPQRTDTDVYITSTIDPAELKE